MKLRLMLKNVHQPIYYLCVNIKYVPANRLFNVHLLDDSKLFILIKKEVKIFSELN